MRAAVRETIRLPITMDDEEWHALLILVDIGINNLATALPTTRNFTDYHRAADKLRLHVNGEIT